MSRIALGKDVETGRPQWIDSDILACHLHLAGATGTGKSNAILRILEELVISTLPRENAIFLIDPIGNLANDLLTMMASPALCTQRARDRLVYIKPAREDVVMPLNPLAHTSEANRYYQVTRAIDIVLRAWDAQDLSQQPRLAQWMFNAFYSAAAIGVPIALCQYLLRPGTPEHGAILNRIPPQYRAEWNEILRAKGEATRILESTRNRLKPFFVSPNLRRMFSSNLSLLDCEQFIRDRRIVVLDLGSHACLADRDSETIGGMVVNEIFQAAHSLALREGKKAVDPCFVVMDEFQKFVSPDIENALPTVRQLGLRLILAHQSFNQLEQGETDLSQMIWQARSRLIFANNAADADLLADELAKLTFNDKQIKDIRYTVKQRIAGHRVQWLKNKNQSRSQSSSQGSQWSQSETHSHSQQDRPAMAFFDPPPTQTDSHTAGSGDSSSQSEAFGYSNGEAQTLVPIYEDVTEVANVVFRSFEEWSIDWGKKIRTMGTGRAFAMFPGKLNPTEVQVDMANVPVSSKADEQRLALIEKNFKSENFISASTADRLAEEFRVSLLSGGPILIGNRPSDSTLIIPAAESKEPEGPFTV